MRGLGEAFDKPHWANLVCPVTWITREKAILILSATEVGGTNKSLSHFLHGTATSDPVVEAAEVADVRVAHFLQRPTCERSASTAGAIQNDRPIFVECGVVVGRLGIGARFQRTTWHGDGASYLAARRRFGAVANIGDQRSALLDHFGRVSRRDGGNHGMRCREHLFVTGCHRLSLP